MISRSFHIRIVKIMWELSNEEWLKFAEQRDKDGCTPVHLACMHGHKTTFEALFERLEEIVSPM